MPFRQRQERVVLRAIGLSLLFSGVALVTHIVAGLSLRKALLMMLAFPALGFGLAWRTMTAEERRRLTRRLTTGLLAGLLATLSYDVAKYALSMLDPSPYNAFEMIRVSGLLLAAPVTDLRVVYAAGTAFHLLNGICFGVAYWLLFGRYGVTGAILWGLFLETFQLTLYPGWLDVRFYREFVQISALSHLVYGAVLGLSCKRLATLLRKSDSLLEG